MTVIDDGLFAALEATMETNLLIGVTEVDNEQKD